MDPVVFKKTEPQICELCGKLEELRPYGPKGENICFDCGMQDEKPTREKFRKIVFDITTH